MKNHYKAWTTASIKLARESYAEGKTSSQIANDTGRTIPAVKFMLREQGIKKNRRYSKFELAILRAGGSHKEVAKIIDRLPDEIRVKRSNMRKAEK